MRLCRYGPGDGLGFIDGLRLGDGLGDGGGLSHGDGLGLRDGLGPRNNFGADLLGNAHQCFKPFILFLAALILLTKSQPLFFNPSAILLTNVTHQFKALKIYCPFSSNILL